MVNLLTPLFAKLPIPYSNNISVSEAMMLHLSHVHHSPTSILFISILLPSSPPATIFVCRPTRVRIFTCSVAFIFSGFELKTQNKVFRDRHFYFYTTCFFSNDCKVFLFNAFIMRTGGLWNKNSQSALLSLSNSDRSANLALCYVTGSKHYSFAVFVFLVKEDGGVLTEGKFLKTLLLGSHI